MAIYWPNEVIGGRDEASSDGIANRSTSRPHENRTRSSVEQWLLRWVALGILSKPTNSVKRWLNHFVDRTKQSRAWW